MQNTTYLSVFKSLPNSGDEMIHQDQQQAFPQFPQVADLQSAPTAWKSAPGFIRFAVWVWAIGVVVTVIFGVAFAVAAIAELS